MKQNKQKILFILGAFCIIAGIIIAKVSGTMANQEGDNINVTVMGILMIALGAILISTNIIMRLINHSKAKKAKQTHSTED